jgi:hypothetical protein
MSQAYAGTAKGSTGCFAPPAESLFPPHAGAGGLRVAHKCEEGRGRGDRAACVTLGPSSVSSGAGSISSSLCCSRSAVCSCFGAGPAYSCAAGWERQTSSRRLDASHRASFEPTALRP